MNNIQVKPNSKLSMAFAGSHIPSVHLEHRIWQQRVWEELRQEEGVGMGGSAGSGHKPYLASQSGGSPGIMLSHLQQFLNFWETER